IVDRLVNGLWRFRQNLGGPNMQKEDQVDCPSRSDTGRGCRHFVAGVIVFCLAFAILVLGMDRDVNLYDEGLIATGASRIAAGAIPHRDFYTIYGPGQFYILALAFKFFGPSLLIERIWDLVIKSGIVCLVVSIAIRMMRRGIVTMVVVVCI